MFGYVPFLYAPSHFHWFPIIWLVLHVFTKRGWRGRIFKLAQLDPVGSRLRDWGKEGATWGSSIPSVSCWGIGDKEARCLDCTGGWFRGSAPEDLGADRWGVICLICLWISHPPQPSLYNREGVEKAQEKSWAFWSGWKFSFRDCFLFGYWFLRFVMLECF